MIIKYGRLQDKNCLIYKMQEKQLSVKQIKEIIKNSSQSEVKSYQNDLWQMITVTKKCPECQSTFYIDNYAWNINAAKYIEAGLNIDVELNGTFELFIYRKQFLRKIGKCSYIDEEGYFCKYQR